MRGQEEVIWTECWDPDTGRYYYYNSLDDSSQWEKPMGRSGRLLQYTTHESHHPPNQHENKEEIDPLDYAENGFTNQMSGTRLGVSHRKDSRSYEYSLDAEKYYREIELSAYSNETAFFAPLTSTKVSKSIKNTHPRDILSGGATKDYIGLARIYRLESKYREKKGPVTCVLCYEYNCSDVFFPCEHMCVCRNCIIKEKIKEESSIGEDDYDSFCYCPLCNSVIKKILPFQKGKEVEKYWNWIHEVKPTLPKEFLRNFKHSGAIIQKIYIDENIPSGGKTHRLSGSNSCCIS